MSVIGLRFYVKIRGYDKIDINKKGITPDYNVPLKPEYKVDRQLEKAVELLKSAK